MKLIKLGFLFSAAVMLLSSCLKSRSDLAGMLDDKGQVVTSILEKAYQSGDANNSHNGWLIYSFFDFNSLPNEEVKFFTLHITQTREAKMNGPLTVKVAMSAAPGATAFPAGAVTVTDIVIPQNSADVFDYPVKFKVNKTGLDPDALYGATFTITSVSQGIYTANESKVTVYSNLDDVNGVLLNANSSKSSVYTSESTVSDPLGEIGHTQNRARVLATSTFEYAAPPVGSANNYVFWNAHDATPAFITVNRTTGAFFDLLEPMITFNATNGVTAVTDLSGTYTPTLVTSNANKYVYTSNDVRTIDFAYTISYTSTIGGTPKTRPVTITVHMTVDPLGAFY